MALVRTNRIGSQSATGIGTASYTTASFTPSNNSLLVVIATSASGTTISANNLTVADSLGTLTYTSRLAVTNTNNNDALRIWTAPVGTGASMTVTIDAGADSADIYTVAIFDYTGYDTGTPTGATASKTAGASDGADSITLSAAPASTSEVIGVLERNDSGATSSTPGATFTEQYDLDTSGHGGAEVETRTASTSTTVDWVDVQDAGGGVLFAATLGALEIRAAAADSSSLPPPPFFGPFSWLWQTQYGVDPTVVTALDVVPASPLPLVEWLRRRPDYEAEQQPRRLLDVSVTQSVDAPNPQPLPVVEWLRRRHDYEAEQQSRHLVDVSETQGVPLPTPLPVVEWLRRRPDYEAEQQPRRLLDITVTQSVDSPPIPALPTVEWLRRRPDYETEQQPQRLTDTSVTQSVDSPTIRLAGQWEPVAKRVDPQQQRLLPVDVLAPFVQPDSPTGAPFTQTEGRPYPYEAWLQGRLLDVSITQSVDSPPGIAVQPSSIPRPRWQGQQAVPLAVDLLAPVTGPFGAVQQVAGYQRVTTWQQWLQVGHLDLSITQSVDSPPGFFRPALPSVTRSGVQYEQAVNRYLDQPANPTGQQPLEVYARQAAAFQAWQKSPLFLLPSVDAPPLSGPYPTAPYRRPDATRLPAPRFVAAFTIAPAPTITAPLYTVATVDGRLMTVAVIDGILYSAATVDGRLLSFAVVDGKLVTLATDDGRRRDQ